MTGAQTKSGPLTIAAWVCVVVGFLLLGAGLFRSGLVDLAGGQLLALVHGLGPLLALLGSGLTTLGFSEISAAVGGVATVDGVSAIELGSGVVLWILGWGVLAFTLRGVPVEAEPSVARGKPLHARLRDFQDFHWGTLAAYGFGVFIAEVAFITVYLLLVAKGAAQGGEPSQGLSPVWAFVSAFFGAMAITFGGGFLGAANSKRLSVPEATIGLLYFGVPIPLFLTAMHHVPQLMLKVGYLLRELVYLSSLLGDARPEMGYWLVFLGLALALVLGIAFGFVATSSGRLDLKTSYETFIAARHVSVFQPRLILGVFIVLLGGVLVPVLIWVVMLAINKVVERTRIRKLGLKDPLLAAEALNRVKMNEQTPTGLMTGIAVIAVGVGVNSLIIVLSVMSGFEADLQKKILGTNSHGVVLKYASDMAEYENVMDKVSSVRGIKGYTPFIMGEVMISSEGNISGSMIKGIDPKTVGTVTDLPSYLLPGGNLDWLNTPEKISAKRLAPFGGGAIDDRPASPDSPLNKQKPKAPDDIERDPLIDAPAPSVKETVLPGILIGRELAAALKVVVGDRVNVVSPVGGELGPQGPMPKSRPFRVAGIFYSGMYEYDSKFVYIHLKEAQTFFNIKGASGIEVKVVDIDDARAVMKTIYDKLDGYPYRTKDWGEMNRNLFAALRLEKLVMAIILSVTVIIAAMLVIATIIMLVLEKRKEIAVLKALGVSDGGIVKIFVSEGLQIGLLGAALGAITGLLACLFIEKVGIKLDPQVYYIPALPVRIEPFQTALAVIIAILVTFLASIYPALKASQVEPVDGLKAE